MIPRIFLSVLITCMSAWSATYYVDGGNSLANNSNTGTAALPWKTIQKAANTVKAGDSVIVKTGTYNERITFSSGHSGTTGKKIVFKADPRRTVFMQGFSTDGVNNLRIEGFDISYNQGGWLGGGVWLSSDTVEVVDNYLHDIPGPGIQMSWSGGPWKSVYIGNNHVFKCQYGLTVSGSNILIENNEVERLFQFDSTGDCDYSRFFGDSITFRGNFFHNTLMSEVGTAHLDCFQTFDNNGEHVANVMFDGNRCSECDEGLMGEATFYHKSHDIIFKNNIFAHSGAWGLCVKDITNVKVYNNVFFDIQYHGAGFSGAYATGEEVINNIFYKSETSYWSSDSGQVTGDYNIVFQSDKPAGTHNKINADPLFADTAAGDFHLKPGSPAIDAGTRTDAATDFDGKARPVNGAFDIGAFEFSNASVKGGRIAGRDPMLHRTLVPSPINAPLFRQYMRKCGNIVVYDCGGKRINASELDKQGMVIVKNAEAEAAQKVFVIK